MVRELTIVLEVPEPSRFFNLGLEKLSVAGSAKLEKFSRCTTVRYEPREPTLPTIYDPADSVESDEYNCVDVKSWYSRMNAHHTREET